MGPHSLASEPVDRIHLRRAPGWQQAGQGGRLWAWMQGRELVLNDETGANAEDGKYLLFTRIDCIDADLMVVENFRGRRHSRWR